MLEYNKYLLPFNWIEHAQKPDLSQPTILKQVQYYMDNKTMEGNKMEVAICG